MTPDEMRAGLLKAFELLTYGSPDRELHDKVGITKWVDDCDAWLDKFAPSRVRLPDEPTADWPMLLKSCPDTEFMAFFEDNPDMAYVVSASAKLQPGHWICQNADCKGHNFPDDLVCIHCGADPKNFPPVHLVQSGEWTITAFDSPAALSQVEAVIEPNEFVMPKGAALFEDMETAAHAFFNSGQHAVAGTSHVQAVHQFAKWLDEGAPGYLRRAENPSGCIPKDPGCLCWFMAEYDQRPDHDADCPVRLRRAQNRGDKP